MKKHAKKFLLILNVFIFFSFNSFINNLDEEKKL